MKEGIAEKEESGRTTEKEEREREKENEEREREREGRMKRAGDVLRQALMSKEEYELLRPEEKVWTWMQRPLLLSLVALLFTGVLVSGGVCISIVFPRTDIAFCARRRLSPLLPTEQQHELMHAFVFTEDEATRYFWLAAFLPTAIVLSASLLYLIAGMAVAFSAPKRHGCIKVVENNCCASKKGGVRCLSILNGSFAVVFGFMALLLGSSVATLETDCSIVLFWCYEVICWSLTLLYGGTCFFLRRKAAVIMDEGEFYGSRTTGMELLEAAPAQLLSPDIQGRVNAAFRSWMGPSILSSDEDDEEPPKTGGLDDVWEEDNELYEPIPNPRNP